MAPANLTYRRAGCSMTGSLGGRPFSVILHACGKTLRPGTYRISPPRKHPSLGVYALVSPLPAIPQGSSAAFEYTRAPMFQYHTSPAFQYDSSPALQYDTSPAFQYDTSPAFQYDTDPAFQYDTDPGFQYDSDPEFQCNRGAGYLLSARAIAGVNTLVAGYGAGALMRSLREAGGGKLIVV